MEKLLISLILIISSALLISCQSTQPTWFLLQDDKLGWNVSNAMPTTQNGDAGGIGGKPTVVGITSFLIPPELNCSSLTIDIPLYRRFPQGNVSMATDPGPAHFFLWENTPPVGTWGAISQRFIASWVPNVPAYNGTWAPTRSLGVYRYVLNLPATRAIGFGQNYYLGGYIEQTQFGNAKNTIYWLTANTSYAPFQYIDVFGNYLTNPIFSQPQASVTTAPTATIYYANISVTYLATTVFAKCIVSPGNSTPPLIRYFGNLWEPTLGPVLDPAVVTPTIAFTPTSMTPTPSAMFVTPSPPNTGQPTGSPPPMLSTYSGSAFPPPVLPATQFPPGVTPPPPTLTIDANTSTPTTTDTIIGTQAWFMSILANPHPLLITVVALILLLVIISVAFCVFVYRWRLAKRMMGLGPVLLEVYKDDYPGPMETTNEVELDIRKQPHDEKEDAGDGEEEEGTLLHRGDDETDSDAVDSPRHIIDLDNATRI